MYFVKQAVVRTWEASPAIRTANIVSLSLAYARAVAAPKAAAQRRAKRREARRRELRDSRVTDRKDGPQAVTLPKVASARAGKARALADENGPRKKKRSNAQEHRHVLRMTALKPEAEFRATRGFVAPSVQPLLDKYRAKFKRAWRWRDIVADATAYFEKASNEIDDGEPVTLHALQERGAWTALVARMTPDEADELIKEHTAAPAEFVLVYSRFVYLDRRHKKRLEEQAQAAQLAKVAAAAARVTESDDDRVARVNAALQSETIDWIVVPVRRSEGDGPMPSLEELKVLPEVRDEYVRNPVHGTVLNRKTLTALRKLSPKSVDRADVKWEATVKSGGVRMNTTEKARTAVEARQKAGASKGAKKKK
jgi:hypothetical protein